VNIGPAELLIVLLVLLFPLVVLVAIVAILRSGKHRCPACQKRISAKATVCPYCRTSVGRLDAPTGAMAAGASNERNLPTAP